jgi:hypothetical protein
LYPEARNMGIMIWRGGKSWQTMYFCFISAFLKWAFPQCPEHDILYLSFFLSFAVHAWYIWPLLLSWCSILDVHRCSATNMESNQVWFVFLPLQCKYCNVLYCQVPNAITYLRSQFPYLRMSNNACMDCGFGSPFLFRHAVMSRWAVDFCISKRYLES